jgi:hypothetical protein
MRTENITANLDVLLKDINILMQLTDHPPNHASSLVDQYVCLGPRCSATQVSKCLLIISQVCTLLEAQIDILIVIFAYDPLRTVVCMRYQ